MASSSAKEHRPPAAGPAWASGLSAKLRQGSRREDTAATVADDLGEIALSLGVVLAVGDR